MIRFISKIYSWILALIYIRLYSTSTVFWSNYLIIRSGWRNKDATVLPVRPSSCAPLEITSQCPFPASSWISCCWGPTFLPSGYCSCLFDLSAFLQLTVDLFIWPLTFSVSADCSFLWLEAWTLTESSLKKKTKKRILRSQGLGILSRPCYFEYYVLILH